MGHGNVTNCPGEEEEEEDLLIDTVLVRVGVVVVGKGQIFTRK
jgi:hypothetical protein